MSLNDFNQLIKDLRFYEVNLELVNQSICKTIYSVKLAILQIIGFKFKIYFVYRTIPFKKKNAKRLFITRTGLSLISYN